MLQFFVLHAQHSYYRDLLEAGVRNYLYPAPNILHAKHISVDDLVSVVGSSSLDIRFLQLDQEFSMMVVCDQSFTDARRARHLLSVLAGRRHFVGRAVIAARTRAASLNRSVTSPSTPFASRVRIATLSFTVQA